MSVVLEPALPAPPVPARPAGARRRSPRQREILADLEALFLNEGFRHLTIADLADRLRCSRRTLYSLAPSREELVLVVIDRLLNRMGVEARARAAAHNDPGDAIAAYLDTGVSTLARARPAFIEDLETYLPTKHLYDRHLAIAMAVLRARLEDGIAKGVFRGFHAALVAEILDAAVDRIRRPEILDRTGVSSSQAVKELSDLLRHGLLQSVPGGGTR
jgi:AcrR family transcriptional regulator